jgi:anti-sigma B factor antagonist
MALQGTTREVQDIIIVDFSGKITLGEGSALLRRTIKDMIDRGHNKLLINL